MTLAIIPFIVFVIGLIMLFASNNDKVTRTGEIACFCGLFITLATLASQHMVSLGH